MLAQSFMTAADLAISEEQKAALIKTLVLLETDKLIHVPVSWYAKDRGGEFTGHFNMHSWISKDGCGTVACIGGTAELVGNVSFGPLNRIKGALADLFVPHVGKPMDMITPAEAAVALRSYLTIGDAHWELAVPASSHWGTIRL